MGGLHWRRWGEVWGRSQPGRNANLSQVLGLRGRRRVEVARWEVVVGWRGAVALMVLGALRRGVLLLLEVPLGREGSVCRIWRGSQRGNLWQRRHNDPGNRFQRLALLELLQDFLKSLLQLRLVLQGRADFLLPVLPLVGVLLRELHPQNVKVLFHLQQVTNG